MRTSRWIRALCGALLVSGVLTIAASPAGAATVTVSTEAQLRTALADPATTMVTLANSIDLVDCSPSGGDLDRIGALVLDGGGFTLRQTCAGERVLESTSGTLTLQHLTVTGGDQSGSGIVLGGGVLAANDLVLDTTTVTGNKATSDGSLSSAGTFGGGVEADGAITLVGSHVDGNTASSTAGSYGAGVLGGAGQDVTITDSTVDGNIAETTDAAAQAAGVNGGGVALAANHNNSSTILDPAGTVRVVRSSVSENIEHPVAAELPFAVGGGVFADTVELDDSHVDANELHPAAIDDYAVGWGGGVFADTNLTAEGSTLSRNLIDPDAPQEIAEYAAAMVEHTITLTNSRVQDNRAAADGPSGHGSCGGVLATAGTVTASAVTGNETSGSTFALGGGLCIGTATVDATTVVGNSVESTDGTSIGAGVVVDSGEIRDSNVSGNSVIGRTARGAGIAHAEFGGIASPHALTVVDSTVTDNAVLGDTLSFGGGIAQSDIGSISLVFSTIAGNSAPTGANLGASANPDPVTSFASSISGPFGGGTNCGGVTMVDQGSTQVTDTSCGTVASADPQLGVLADNGGPTFTMLPSATSPLLDRVPNDACLALVALDQRGVTRPQGSACDIGAVERAVPPAPTPDPTPAPTPLPAAVDGPTAAPAVVAEPRFTG